MTLKTGLTTLATLTRPLSSVKNAAVILLAYYLVGQPDGMRAPLLCFLALSLTCAGGYAYNTLTDRELDRKNQSKEHFAAATTLFGARATLTVSLLCVLAGALIAASLNIHVLAAVLLLALANFLYSWPRTRFKDHFLLDIIFGATLTLPLRFVAAWFLYSFTFPSLGVLVVLAAAKSGGYMLYKLLDVETYRSAGVHNSITRYRYTTVLHAGFALIILALAITLVLCLNSVFLILPVLGSAPFEILWLMPATLPTLIILYCRLAGVTRTPVKTLRRLGLLYGLAVIAAYYFFANH